MMVLHDHQANPHVHISVRAESRIGKRLDPRKADLQRRRETFTLRANETAAELAFVPRSTARCSRRARSTPRPLATPEAGPRTRHRRDHPCTTYSTSIAEPIADTMAVAA